MEREAAIRLMLRAGPYLGGLQHIEKESKRVGSKIGSVMSAGFKGAKSAAIGLGNQIKTTLATAAQFGGIFAVGAAAKKGLELQETYANIAFNLNKASGEARTWKDVQKDIEPIALKTSRSSAEMADAFSKVYENTGDAEYARASLESIGETANATGYSVDQLANAAQIMQRKFGASKDEIPEMMARFVEKVGVGGAGIEGLGNKFALMAGEASAAGLKGKDGLSTLLGVMIALDSRVGEKTEPGLKRLLQVLKKGSNEMKRLEKKGRVKFDADEGAFDKVRKVLSGKGRVEMEAILTGESRTVFDELARPFDEAFKAAKEKGASTKEATKAGLEAFDKAMKEAGKSSLTAARISEESAKRAEDPQRKLAQAMETFAQEFTKPQMIEAIKELAKSLPKLAKGMAELVEFTANHPVLAAGAYGGLKIGGGAIGSMAVTGAKEAAGTFATTAGASSAWAGAAGSFAAAAAPLLAAYITKEAIDKSQEMGDKSGKKRFNIMMEMTNLRSKIRSQGGRATEEDIAKAKALEAQYKDSQNDQLARSISKELGLGDSGVGAVRGVMAGSGTAILLDQLFRSAGKSSSGTGAGSRTLAGGTSAADQDAAIRDFIHGITQTTGAVAKMAGELNKVKAPSGGGGNGLPKPPPNNPGYT